MLLDINERERVLLQEILSRELKGLHGEIAHTDRRDYRDGLKQRLGEIELLADRLVPQIAVPIDVGPLG